MRESIRLAAQRRCVPVNSDYKGFPSCQANSGLYRTEAIGWLTFHVCAGSQAKGADSETTNGH